METTINNDNHYHLKNLFAALAKAHNEIENAYKSQENPAFKKGGKNSTYADISDVIDAIRDPASENGLSVTFNYKTEFVEGKPFTFIRYLLAHDSGEYIISDWVLMFMRDNTPHSFGAANTYYRRQLLKGIYQIPEHDDDGNAESGVVEGMKSEPEKYKAKKKVAPSSPQNPPSFPPPGDHFPEDAPQSEPYIIPVPGPYQGREISSIPPQNLKSYCVQLKANIKDDTPAYVNEFLDKAREFLKRAGKG